MIKRIADRHQKRPSHNQGQQFFKAKAQTIIHQDTIVETAAKVIVIETHIFQIHQYIKINLMIMKKLVNLK